MNIFSQPMNSHTQYVHNNLKCSNNSKHCQWPGIKLTEHTCIWSMKTINILVHILVNKLKRNKVMILFLDLLSLNILFNEILKSCDKKLLKIFSFLNYHMPIEVSHTKGM